MTKAFARFQISQVGLLIRDGKCLLLQFSGGSERWGLPGGRVDEGEFVGDPNLSERAFRREMKEETGLEDFEILGVVDYDLWYTGDGIPICGIVNLIESKTEEIQLSHEHTRFAWASPFELDQYPFVWPKLKQMIEKGFQFSPL
ncbi:MAG: NUDIX domain-containing protein [Candidatus Uhrbacteria bacterium]|nr:NUDIX domain-containing protein [Candidatus Uhrbacteria bacterium]MDP3793939.1 NUDIX domain-containing protein [Candidatus Uhrbacteria bacterium]